MKSVKKTINTYQLKIIRDSVEILKATGEIEAHNVLKAHYYRMERHHQEMIHFALEHKKARANIRKKSFSKMFGVVKDPNEDLYFKSRDEAESHRKPHQKISKNRTFGYYLKTI